MDAHKMNLTDKTEAELEAMLRNRRQRIFDEPELESELHQLIDALQPFWRRTRTAMQQYHWMYACE